MIVGHLFIVLILATCHSGFPVPENPKIPSAKVLDFLKKFGYIEDDDENSGALYTENGISETIKNVQKFGALTQTGVLDNATLALMSAPRCGVPDIIKNKRTKRYAFGSEGWKKRTISYFVANWSPKIGQESVSRNIDLALNTWGKYGRLHFEKRNSPDADIIVAFGSGYHGDTNPFDGPGNILAHAFFPNEDQGFGGDIHFDADENWVDNRNGKKNEDGTDFSTVALHELGHSLGLSHSVVPEAVMFPYYQGFEPGGDLQLGYDDILGMYELYIRRNFNNNLPTTSSEVTTSKASTEFDQPTTSSYHPTTSKESTESYQPTTSEEVTDSSTSTVVYHGDNESVETHKTHDPKHHIPSTNSPSLPNICDGYFDAVAVLREELFFFKEQYLWRLKELGKIEPSYPIIVTQMFPDLPKTIKKIDAAYERPDGMIVLFTGNKYWVYDGKKFIENSPKSVTEDYGLPSSLDSVDAVQVWAKNGKTYIYKEDMFWRYNETTKLIDEGYPKHMGRWRGVPYNLDAATTWKGITYFFRDKLYWKFDNNWIITTDESPLPSPQRWLGCPEDENTFSQLFDKNYE